MINEFVRYTNKNNENIELSLFSPLLLAKFKDSMDVNFYTTKNALEDGEIVEGNDLEPREIVITGKYMINDSYKDLERRIRKVFNPKIGGTIYYTANNETKEMPVEVDGIPEFKYKGIAGYATIKLIGYGSYWQKSAVTEQLSVLNPEFVFPQHFKNSKFIFGKKSSQLVSSFVNVGDVDCGYIINIKATFGTASNPFVLEKKQKKGLYFTKEMKKDDVITIDLMQNQPIIYFNGVKDFTFLDAVKSDFFKLLVGENTIEYGASNNVNNLEISVLYRPLIL